MNEKMTMEHHEFYIARVHFKDGTFHDEKLYCSSGDCITDYITKCKEQGYIYIQTGISNTRIPYHNVTKITSNYCETVRRPCCDSIGFSIPKEIK